MRQQIQRRATEMQGRKKAECFVCLAGFFTVYNVVRESICLECAQLRGRPCVRAKRAGGWGPMV